MNDPKLSGLRDHISKKAQELDQAIKDKMLARIYEFETLLNDQFPGWQQKHEGAEADIQAVRDFVMNRADRNWFRINQQAPLFRAEYAMQSITEASKVDIKNDWEWAAELKFPR